VCVGLGMDEKIEGGCNNNVDMDVHNMDG